VVLKHRGYRNGIQIADRRGAAIGQRAAVAGVNGPKQSLRAADALIDLPLGFIIVCTRVLEPDVSLVSLRIRDCGFPFRAADVRPRISCGSIRVLSSEGL